MLDIHCHVLPGVDDGARTTEDSVSMLAAARASGVDRMVATPHVRDVHADLARMDEAYDRLLPVAAQKGVRLYMGYEVNIAALSRMSLKWIERLCVLGTNCVLVELPNTLLPPNWDILLSEISAGGFNPIIVHPERCAALRRTPELMGEMRGYGCEFQIDAGGLFGPLLSPERRLCRTLIKRGLIDYIASDAHTAAQYDSFRRALRWTRSRMPTGGLLDQYLK